MKQYYIAGYIFSLFSIFGGKIYNLVSASIIGNLVAIVGWTLFGVLCVIQIVQKKKNR